MVESDWVDVIPEEEWVDVAEEVLPRGGIKQLLFSSISKQLMGQTITERLGTAERRRKEMTEFAAKRAIAGKPASVGELMSRGALSVAAETLIDLADVSPADIAAMVALPVAGKAVGKIPFRGTTIGKVAKTIPAGRGFMRNVEELGRYEQTLKRITPLSSRGIPSLNPIQKITQALEEAIPIRKKQEALYTAERTRRTAEVAALGEKVSGEKGYYAQLGALKGELPKAEFAGLRSKISQSDIDTLFNNIEQNQILLPLEKITAKTGLMKLLGEQGGIVPTKGEIKLLSEVFPKEFIGTILNKRPLSEKAGEGLWEILNIPRAVMASTDLSAPFRQGVFLVGRPKQFMPAFGAQVKYFFSEKAYQGLYDDIITRPSYDLMRKGKLQITRIGNPLNGREEQFMSNLAEKIPIAGKLIRASDRAFTGFLNKLRADVFDDLIKSAQNQGIEIKGRVLDDIANFVNTATGRGNLGALENASVALNSVFFSPRLMASRLSLLNPAYYINLEPFARKEALKSLITFSGTASSVLGLAKIGGADIGIDPRSADFGKIKIGNTRYDILGGFQQYIKIGAQLITGKHISSTTGVETTFGEGYKPLTRLDIIQRFLETKEAPVASFVTSMLRGQNYMGEKFNIGKETASRFTPMVIQDMADLYMEKGLEGVAMGSPAIFGVGVQTYSPTASEMVRTSNSVKTHFKELLNRGRVQEARELLDRNRNIIIIGEQLKPYQDIVNQYDKLKELIKDNPIFSNNLKKQKISNIEDKIKGLQKIMDEQYEKLK